jgi:hypothetical protein
MQRHVTCGQQPAFGGRWLPESGPAPQAAAALVALGVLGTGVAYVLNCAVIRSAGLTVASAITYAVLLWSTALGGLLLNEGVGWASSRAVHEGEPDEAARPERLQILYAGGFLVRRSRPPPGDGTRPMLEQESGEGPGHRLRSLHLHIVACAGDVGVLAAREPGDGAGGHPSRLRQGFIEDGL